MIIAIWLTVLIGFDWWAYMWSQRNANAPFTGATVVWFLAGLYAHLFFVVYVGLSGG